MVPPPPPLPDTDLVAEALLIEDAEPIESVESRPSIKPPPMPSTAPPLPAAVGLAHSGPPALPSKQDTEVMLVDDAELLEEA